MKAKILVKFLLVTLFFSGILFLFAGKIDYYQGWLFLGTNMLASLMNFLTVRNNTELIKERSKIGEGSKSWDKLLLGLSSMTYFLFLAVAGLDSGRYGWSPDFHWSLYVSGVVLTIGGQIIFLAAKKENKYFSTVVRIQTDRGHQVCQTGIYKIVRHPGYTGMIISSAALPLLTGSIWGIIPVAISIILMIVRTYLEDNTLKKELAGYVEYSQVTRKRLIPKIW